MQRGIRREGYAARGTQKGKRGERSTDIGAQAGTHRETGIGKERRGVGDTESNAEREAQRERHREKDKERKTKRERRGGGHGET